MYSSVLSPIFPCEWNYLPLRPCMSPDGLVRTRSRLDKPPAARILINPTVPTGTNPARAMSGEHDSENPSGGQDFGLAVEEAKPKLKKPPLYRVVLLNDDYTPMEFVVEVLELVFAMDRPKATRVMLEVHTKGKGVCGVYTYEIAETKVAQVSSYAEQHQHPLLCTMEEA